MSQIKRIGIDTSKAVFTLHGVDQAGQPVLRTNLRRAQMILFFKKLPPTDQLPWKPAPGRLASLGSIAGRPWPHRAPASTAIRETPLREARQERPQRRRGDLRGRWASGDAVRAGKDRHPTGAGDGPEGARDVGQRTQLVNALRGHGAEFGVIAAKGDPTDPAPARGDRGRDRHPVRRQGDAGAIWPGNRPSSDSRIKAIEVKLIAMHKANPRSAGCWPPSRASVRSSRADPGNRGRSGSVQIRPSSGGLARTGAKGTFAGPVASNAWAASAVLAMNGCASCW